MQKRKPETEPEVTDFDVCYNINVGDTFIPPNLTTVTVIGVHGKYAWIVNDKYQMVTLAEVATWHRGEYRGEDPYEQY